MYVYYLERNHDIFISKCKLNFRFPLYQINTNDINVYLNILSYIKLFFLLSKHNLTIVRFN